MNLLSVAIFNNLNKFENCHAYKSKEIEKIQEAQVAKIYDVVDKVKDILRLTFSDVDRDRDNEIAMKYRDGVAIANFLKNNKEIKRSWCYVGW